MHRFRSWTLDPSEWRTQRNRLLPIEGGDGSTLSLDFTTGVLDSRLSFTRNSDATFINSQGFVQYADANHVRNSTMLVSTMWTQSTTGTGATTINGDGSVRFNGAGGRATWLQTIALAAGLQTTFSFRVTAFTNTDLRTSDLFTAGFGFTGQQYFYTDENGTTHSLTAFESLPKTGTNGRGVYSCTATTTGISCNVVFGADCNGVGRLGDVTIRDPQVQYGTVVPRRAYVPNSSTSSSKWDSPRFDYDPTEIGTKRGLLIEGDVTTISAYSEDFSNAYWSKPAASVTTDSIIGPNNVAATTRRIKEDNTNAQHGLRRQFTITNGTTYTVSVFIKPGSYDSFGLEMYQSGTNFAKAEVTSINGNLQTVTGAAGNNVNFMRTVYSANGWYRYALTFTATATALADFNVLLKQTNAYAGNNVNYMDVFGFQLEQGLGASSYIPTGASTAQKTQDVLTIGVTAGTENNFSSWWPLNLSQFTVLWEGDLTKQSAGNQFLWLTRTSGGTSVMRVLATTATGSPVNGFAGNTIAPPVAVNGITAAIASTSNYLQLPYYNLRTVLAVKEGDQAFYANNGIYSSSQTATNTGLAFTSVNMNFNPNNDQFMHIKKLKFWPSRLSNNVLELLVNDIVPSPYLDFNFLTSTLDSRLSFTRSSNATYIDSTGTIKYAFSNRISNSASLSGFNANGVTATADPSESGPVGAPSGTQATKVTVNAGATSVSFNRNFGAGAGTSTGMTFSVYIKSNRLNNKSGFRYSIRNETTTTNIYGVDIVWENNPVTVVESINSTNGDYELIGPDSKGWYRIIIKVTNTSLIQPGDNITVYAGYSAQSTGFFDPSGEHWVWGAQLEPGLTASPIYLTDSTSTGYFNTPRFDYNPAPASIGTLRGLLIEGKQTNLLPSSETFATTSGWSLNNLQRRTTNSTTAPDGTIVYPFETISGTFTTATYTMGSAIGNSVDTVNFSVFWKKGNVTETQNSGTNTSAGREFTIYKANSSTFAYRVLINTDDPTQFSVQNGSGRYTATPLKNGWWRLSLSATVASTDTIRVYCGSTGSTVSAAGLYWYMWGAQLETGSSSAGDSGASSYIPTGASTVTRTAENLSITSANIPSFNNKKATAFCEWIDGQCQSLNDDNTPTFQEWVFSFGASNSNGAGIFLSDTVGSSVAVTGGVSNAGDANSSNNNLGSINKSAITITIPYSITNPNGYLGIATNGSSVTLGTNFSNYYSASVLSLGNRNNGTRYLNGWLRSFKYWPLVLPSYQLTPLVTV